MNIILAVYSENAFKEYPLPSLNNADYSIILKKDFFHLAENLKIKMEVMDKQWKIKEDRPYKVLWNDQKYLGEKLEDGSVIQIISERKERVSILVKYVEHVFQIYEKFHLGNMNTISIGKESTNDISYDYLQLVSRKHAVIEKCSKGYKIVNKSKNGTYVNSHRVDGECMLEFGAYINIMGLHMVYLGDLLAIDMAGSNAQIQNQRLVPYKVEEQKGSFYEETDYSKGKEVYHRAPRNYEVLQENSIEIEGPPQLNKGKKQSLFMSIGPSITMTIPMMMGSMMMISSSQSTGGSSSLSMYSGLIMSISSAAIGVGWTLANIRNQNKEEKQQDQLRFKAYSQYLIEKTEEIKKKYQSTCQILEEMYPDAEKSICVEGIEKGILWNRNIAHKDYLQQRVGKGNLPFPIGIDVPKKRFSIQKDELSEKPLVIKENYEILYDVPITIDLGKHNLIGIVGGCEKINAIEIAKCISAQIAANNCYTDVKMGFVYDKENSQEDVEFRYAKWFPHVWSEDKKTRYIATDQEQASEVFYELTKIFRNRMEEKKEGGNKKEDLPKPYYVLFISDLELLEGELLAKYIFEKDQACGLTTILLTERYEELPNVCDFIIENTEQFQGMYETTANIDMRQKIKFDTINGKKLEKFARHIARIQVQEMEKGGEVPGGLTFLEMLDVGSPKEIPVKELWAKNRTYDNIKGLLGQKAGGVPCYLDVHEKYHGPHGLVAGTTGSGKSETLQTYMMALAVNYSPDDIGFFIIDYKGGGMANLFDGLPHMIGSISNLSGNQVKRAMISIKSENRRRQRVFTEHGVNNINLYTKLYKNGEATYPIPHLFIIIDEFAELKREEPEFMKELISVAQVGRSLGVHLILATQKPSGTVDDNIWSNSKFRLCLRVQDKQDSNDMLHKPDAAYITQAGRGYLQVGNDEVYDLFQSGYSGATYEEEAQVGNIEIAKIIKANGKVDLTGNSVKLSQKKKVEYTWIEKVVHILEESLQKLGYTEEVYMESQDKGEELAEQMYKMMQQKNIEYPESKYNTDRLLDFLELYVHTKGQNPQKDFVDAILENAAKGKTKLPQRKEKTQLDAVKEHLSVVAEENGYHYHMQLWMPVLPEHIYLEDFQEYKESCYTSTGWNREENTWSLEFVLGKMDDPENQNQMPLMIDFAKDGHIAILGNVVSGKSTMMQTMAYALMQKYSPEMINLYAIDFSSKMMSAFEEAPHMGGVMYESDLEKIAKFFNMIHSILEERKLLFRGGNYSQYVQVHGIVLPAIVLFVDNYASFKEKTEEKYEDMMIKLSKEGVSHGIFLVVSGGGYGMNDITGRIGENINTTLCLSLQDKFAYMDLLHASQIEVLPEGGIKGRGLAYYGNRVLEYQTALAIEAENDYQRIEMIKEVSSNMKKEWDGKVARRIPEIPKKPVWSEFHMLEEYEQKLQKEEFLPIGYDASNAEVYSIDLSKTYCYLVTGAARTGRTNFMKVCVQAAEEKDTNICIFDSPKLDFKVYAEKENITYATEEEGIFKFFTELLPVFKERNVKKNTLLNAEYEEEEIYEEMKREKPYFIFISDLVWFVDLIYNAEHDMRGFLENILEKGFLHNIFFFGDLPLEKRGEVGGYQIYEHFISYKTGIHLGGKTGDNPILNFDYLSYMEKEKSEKPGIGSLPDVAMEGETEKVVIPMARR